MKKVLLVMSLSMFCLLNVFAQNFSPVAKLVKGNKITVKKVSYADPGTRETNEMMGLPTPDSTAIEETLVVSNVTATDVTLLVDAALDPTQAMMLEQLQIPLPPKEKYEVITNLDGSQPRLKDPAAALKVAHNQYDAIIKSLRANKNTAAMMSFIEPSLNSARDLITLKTVNDMMVGDIANYLLLQGTKPTTTAVQRIKDGKINSPAGNVQLKAEIDYRLKNYNEGKKTAVVETKYSIDKADLKQKMFDLMKTSLESLKALGGEMPSEGELRKRVNDEVEQSDFSLLRVYTFDLRTGLPAVIEETYSQKSPEGDVANKAKYILTVK